MTYTLFPVFNLWGLDPTVCSSYKMEVLRDAESKIRPLFRVTMDNGEQVSCTMKQTRIFCFMVTQVLIVKLIFSYAFSSVSFCNFIFYLRV